MITIHQLLDNAKCFETIRALRWPEAVSCPHCESDQITRQGKDDSQPERQRYGCKACQRKFDDLTNTVFAGHHQPLKIWILCLYFMGLNSSFAHFLRQFGRLALFIEKTRQKYRLSISNIIFLDIKPGIFDIKLSLGNSFFIVITENTICSIFKSYEPLEKMSEP